MLKKGPCEILCDFHTAPFVLIVLLRVVHIISRSADDANVSYARQLTAGGEKDVLLNHRLHSGFDLSFSQARPGIIQAEGKRLASCGVERQPQNLFVNDSHHFTSLPVNESIDHSSIKSKFFLRIV